MTVIEFEPRTIVEIRKNDRQAYRLQIIRTEDGPRAALMLYQSFPGGRAIPLPCIDRFPVELLRDLAEGLREVERVMQGDAR